MLAFPPWKARMRKTNAHKKNQNGPAVARGLFLRMHSSLKIGCITNVLDVLTTNEGNIIGSHRSIVVGGGAASEFTTACVRPDLCGSRLPCQTNGQFLFIRSDATGSVNVAINTSTYTYILSNLKGGNMYRKWILFGLCALRRRSMKVRCSDFGPVHWSSAENATFALPFGIIYVRNGYTKIQLNIHALSR